MSLKLMSNVNANDVPAYKILGPEVGRVFPYFIKGGFPVLVEECDSPMPRNFEFVDPTPGMVVVHVRTLQLFHVDVDGELTPIGMRLPHGHNDGRRLGADLDTEA